jgi:hydroxymethylbilane synthase
MKRTLIIGARGSRLSLRQAEIVIGALRAAHPGVDLEVREIRTEGDRSDAPLSQIGGQGVFTRAIEDALLAGSIDIAVHSLKDLPPRLPPGLTIAAVPGREDVRDALVTRGGGLAELPPGARIGTGSERRVAQLRALRPDIEPAEIRGNVDTRIKKVEAGDYDGAVLALAGLRRLGLEGRAAQVFAVSEMMPAAGQGALGVEVREDDRETLEAVRAIDDARAHAAVEAERAFLDALGAGCRMPAGAHATVQGGTVRLAAVLGTGTRLLRDEIAGAATNARALGRALGGRMLAEASGEAAGPADGGGA